MFIPFYNSCHRDFDLLEMSLCYLRRLGTGDQGPGTGKEIGPAIVSWDKGDGFTGTQIQRLNALGATLIERAIGFGDFGWNSSLIGLTTIRHALRRLAELKIEAEWLLKLDSDTMILGPAVLDAVDALEGQAELAGFLQSPPRPETPRGPLLHAGGRCQFLSMVCAATLAGLTYEDAVRMRVEMDSANLCLFEDVVLSYAVQFTGGRVVELDAHVHECWQGSAEEILLQGPRQGTVLHIDGYQGPFGRVESVRRQQIPGLMREMGRYPENAGPACSDAVRRSECPHGHTTSPEART